MRRSLPLLLGLAAGCAGTLYSHYAGPTSSSADEAYACVQAQLKTLGYSRKQYDESKRWFVAQKITKEPSSSGLYRQTIEVLDTRVVATDQGAATLDITARTYDQYATARGEDQQERKASDRVQIDARTLGQACAK
jgi:hypothetical protein